MPIKYTFEQVKNTFIQNNCILLDNEYINQLQKINYIASCGHTNITMFKQFVKGVGIKCKNCALSVLTYESVCKSFEDKECKLCYTKEEFVDYYINNSQKIS